MKTCFPRHLTSEDRLCFIFHKVDPEPIVVHGITIPINGLMNGFTWGYLTNINGIKL